MDTLSDPADLHSPAAVDPGALGFWLGRLQQVLTARVAEVMAAEATPVPTIEAPPDGGLLPDMHLSDEECLIVALVLAPLIRPDLFDRAVIAGGGAGSNLELMGGLRGKAHRGLLPTGDTALLALAGVDTEARMRWQGYLMGGGVLTRKGIVVLHPPHPDEPPMSGQLTLEPDLAERLLTGRNSLPRLSVRFPAEPLDTARDWEDLVLPAQTLTQIREFLAWIMHSTRVLDDWGMRPFLRPGCRAIFCGPPGTGKTLTAALIGKVTGRQVLRVDLSMVVSKYIGETEKNLAVIFDKAERKDWIVFFDEADALFGKRSSVKEAKDRYANQEIAFLLQRIEMFDGLAILASNLAGNVDDAFARRFEHVVHFPMPKAGERHRLWARAMPPGLRPEPAVRLDRIAEQYEISGGSIMNAVRHAALKAAERDGDRILAADLIEGVRRELAKEGRSG